MPPHRRFFERGLLAALLIGLVNGLVFIYLLPPWQHYDEPGHFEYAWLIANRTGLPRPGQYDQQMRREVGASMAENNFFGKNVPHPDLTSIQEPVWIGVAQINSTPLYYWLAALPLRLLKFTDVAVQVRAGRFVSLLLFLGTIFLAWLAAAQATSPGSPLRWVIPICLALMPGVVDILTALIDDAGATFFFSLVIVFGLYILRRGFRPGYALGLALASAACIFTKATTYLALATLVIFLLLALPKRPSRFILPALAILTGIGTVLAVTWNQPAHWAVKSFQGEATRVETQSAPFGSHALQIGFSPDYEPPFLIQELPTSLVHELRGKNVTLGAWMWASRPISASVPTLQINYAPVSREVSLTQAPAFFSSTTFIPTDTYRLSVLLSPQVKIVNNVQYLFDGVLLTEGAFSPGSEPSFKNAELSSGTWNGVEFKNLLAGASGENAWPRIRPGLDRRLNTLLAGQASFMLHVLLDWRTYQWYYQAVAQIMFQTFWGRFSWQQIFLPGWAYFVLGLISLFASSGAVYHAWTRRKHLDWVMILFLFLAILAIWLPAALRGLGTLAGRPFIPSARYAFPSIIPLLIFFCAGWTAAFRAVEGKVHLAPWVKHAALIGFFAALNLVGIWSIFTYYY
jgi:hypothetical protein